MKHLVDLRHKLHSLPELSGKEINTGYIIAEYLQKLNPDKLHRDFGGHGVLAVFDSGLDGDSILFRADIDALPITENTLLEYKSVNPGISHKCGHDGHTAILVGLADYIAYNRPERGKAMLLFQPAEETGEGAYKVIKDLSGYKPDYAFALHNLPGFELNSVVLRGGTFSAASRGMTIELYGKSSHASEPENGINPASTLATLIKELPGLAKGNSMSDDYNMLTIVHCRLGEKAFGTSPGEAVLLLTLRGSSDIMILKLADAITVLVKKHSQENELEYRISFSEVFPATYNNPDALSLVRESASLLDLPVYDLPTPFRWSEDFGHFGSICKSVLFGIGAGINHLPLHNPDYDFPDEIIPVGTGFWISIYNQLLG